MAKLETYVQEACLTTDEFNRPKILKGREAISTLLIHLILLEPGTYPSRPEMGVGLISRYRYNDEESMKKLKQDIEDQVNLYIPEFNSVNVDISLAKDSLNNDIVLEIYLDDVLYKYETAQQENNKIGLIDLKA